VQWKTITMAGFMAVLPLLQSHGEWHDPQAPVRIRVSPGQGPSRPSGGYIVTIPSGGLFPKGPATAVFTEGGKALKHGVLWHDPERAMALIYEAGSSGGVYVYAKPGEIQRWKPDSGLHPGTVVFSRNGSGNLSAAQQLASSLPGRGVHFTQNDLGLRLGGNPSGLGGPFVNYLLGYMVSTDPGRTLISPMAWNGSVSFLFDGKVVNPTKQMEGQGGSGEWFEIDREPHRVEWFHAHNSGQPSVQIMWRRPKATPTELGAETPTNKPPWAVGMMPGNVFIRSGQARAAEVESQDPATPVAAFELIPVEYFWFENYEPMIRYEMRVMTKNPPDTRYTWSFAPNVQITNRASASWLFVTGRRYTVGLKATSGDKTATCQYSFDAFCGGEQGSRITDPETRKLYRAALSDMFDAYPLTQDVLAEWTPGMWDLFWRLVEPGPDRALSHIFTRRWDSVRRTLSVENRRRLQSLFIPMAAPLDPQKTVEWIARFDKEDTDNEWRQALNLRKAEVLMYYLNNLDEAEKLSAKVAAVFLSPHRMQAMVRLGDIALLRGNLDEAIKRYGDVQKRVKHAEQTTERSARVQQAPGGLARSKADVKAQSAPRTTASLQPFRGSVKDWRIGAIRDTAVTETTRNLIRQGYFQEAKDNLDKWEVEFPLSKIGGDYIIVEADYYMKTLDYVRANAMLTAYCRSIDMGNYLAEAMNLKLECMDKLKTNAAEVRIFLEDIKKRFPYHPIAETADSRLQQLGDKP